MTFYHRTLYPATGITHAVLGNFLHKKKEDLIVSTGRILKLLKFDPNNTKEMQTLISVDTNDIICSMSKFRRKNEPYDWILISTDSGNITMFAINAEKKAFEVIIHHKFIAENSRTLPEEHLAVDSQGRAILTESNPQDKVEIPRIQHWAQYLAVDSQGRAFFIAAVRDKKCLRYFPGPDMKEWRIFDASENNTLVYDIAFVDIDSKDLYFGYLEIDYEELHPGVKYEKRERKKPEMVFYKVDVENGEVTEINRVECLDQANSLISVPGRRGLLVCAEDFIAFYSMDTNEIVRCEIPKRLLDHRVFVIFVCSTKCAEKVDSGSSSRAGASFASSRYNIDYLAMTEQGDIFKIQLVVDEFEVHDLVLKYFMTSPVVATALCVSKSGFLFIASEFGNHYIYKMDDLEKHSRVHQCFSASLPLEEGQHFLFKKRTCDIKPVTEIQSLSPIIQTAFAPLLSIPPRLCFSFGHRYLSRLKISQLEADVSYQFHAKIEKKKDEIPLCMWAIKSTESITKVLKKRRLEQKLIEPFRGEESETVIVVSFESSTAVYSYDRTSEYVVEKIGEKLFAASTSTLGCARTGDDAIVQVCPEGICFITNGKNELIHRTKEDDEILDCALNKKYLVMAFRNKELQHHKISDDGHVMKSISTRRLLNGYVTCMLLSDENKSDQMLAVGISLPSSKSSTVVNEVQLFNVNDLEIKFLCMIKLEESPNSFLFMNDKPIRLLVGCKKGTVMTLVIKETSEIKGEVKACLKAAKTEKIGSNAVKLLHVSLGKRVILAVSDHSWFKETVDGKLIKLNSDLSPCICIHPESERIATLLEDSLRVFILENLHPKPAITIENKLPYTCKKFVVDSDNDRIIIIDGDPNTYTIETTLRKIKEVKKAIAAAQIPGSEKPPVNIEGRSWASVMQIFNFSGGNARQSYKMQLFRFDQNDVLLSFCNFELGNDNLILVGKATNFRVATACCDKAEIRTYKYSKKEKEFVYLRNMPVKSAPLDMCYYDGDVLIGTGRKLSLYRVMPDTLELILVCEKKECVPCCIASIYVQQEKDKRILVSDKDLGISYLAYDSSKESLYLLPEDTTQCTLFQQPITAACFCSGNRMARATRYGDIFIVELGTLISRDMSTVKYEDEVPFTLSKEKLIACFHIGEIVTSIQAVNTSPDVPDTLVYTTLSGSIGVLSLIPWQKDAKFVNCLYTSLHQMVKEIEIEPENTKLLLASSNGEFRCRHYKRENVIDGDYLDEFFNLEVEQQKSIFKLMEAEEHVKSISEEIEAEDLIQISNKLKSIRREIMLDFQI